MGRSSMVRILAALTLAVLMAGALAACGLGDDVESGTTGTIDVAKDASVKAQLMTIKTGVQAYAAATGQAPAAADQATLGSYVSPWPANPFTKQPMAPGDQAGDYEYTPGAGTSFTLAVHLSDGSLYTAP